jgi:hypothetical protein
MITWIRIGTQNPLMLGQVTCFVACYINWRRSDKTADFRTNKPSDVISTLVSIYDSKDLFIKELQVLLAQRLLAVSDGNYDNEVTVPINVHIFCADAPSSEETLRS